MLKCYDHRISIENVPNIRLIWYNQQKTANDHKAQILNSNTFVHNIVSAQHKVGFYVGTETFIVKHNLSNI